MTNQLSHVTLFSDLNKVTLGRMFKTDQGWVMDADGQDSAVCLGVALYLNRDREKPGGLLTVVATQCLAGEWRTKRKYS